jgi:hypothetical protein
MRIVIKRCPRQNSVADEQQERHADPRHSQIASAPACCTHTPQTNGIRRDSQGKVPANTPHLRAGAERAPASAGDGRKDTYDAESWVQNFSPRATQPWTRRSAPRRSGDEERKMMPAGRSGGRSEEGGAGGRVRLARRIYDSADFLKR